MSLSAAYFFSAAKRASSATLSDAETANIHLNSVRKMKKESGRTTRFLVLRAFELADGFVPLTDGFGQSTRLALGLVALALSSLLRFASSFERSEHVADCGDVTDQRKTRV